MPHQMLVEPGLVNVNYTMFEATRIHPSWVAQARTYDLVIVPNEFCREIWRRSGAPRDRVAPCPLGIDTELFGRPAAPRPLPASGRVRFLNLSEVNRRKNLGALIRVWQRATTPEDDALLVLKLATDDGGLEQFRAEIDPGRGARSCSSTTGSATVSCPASTRRRPTTSASRTARPGTSR
jgi:hypothetical protein